MGLEDGKFTLGYINAKLNALFFEKKDSATSVESAFDNREWYEKSKYDDYSLGLSIERCAQSAEVQPFKSSMSKTSAQTTPAASEKIDPAIQQEKKDAAVSSIKNSVGRAIGSVYKKTSQQGAVSDVYNDFKELSSSELAQSAVLRNLYAEAASTELLERAKDGNLTVKEYYEAKLQLAMSLLPTDGLSDEEKNLLKQHLASYTKEQLAIFIDKIKYCDSKEYDSLADTVKKMVAQAKAGKSAENAGPMSVAALMEDSVSNEPMTFEQVYFIERGVAYDSDNIDDYNKKAVMYAQCANVVARQQNVHTHLDEALQNLKLASQGAENPQVLDRLQKNLEVGILASLKELYGNDEQAIQNALKQITGDDKITYKDGKLVSSLPQAINSYSLRMIAEKLIKQTDENAAKILNGKSIEDYERKMADSYKLAYGEKNARQLAQAFEDDQEQGVQHIKTGVAIASGAVAAGSMLLFPYCTPMVGKAVIATGSLVGIAGASSVDIVENTTKYGGITEEEKREIAKEISQNALLFVASMGAGNIGNGAKAALLAKNCPKLMAVGADIGIDSTISLLSDLAITGQIDLSAEGVSQLISQLTGVLASKAAAKRTKANTAEISTSQKNENNYHNQTRTTNNTSDIKEFLQSPKIKDEMRADVYKLVKEHPETIDALRKMYDAPAVMSDDFYMTMHELLAKYPDKAQQIVDDMYCVSNFKNKKYGSEFLGGDEAELIKYLAQQSEQGRDNAYLLLSSNDRFKISKAANVNPFRQLDELKKQYPQYEEDINNLALNTGRSYSKIESIIKNLSPENADEILHIASKNSNLNIEHNTNSFKILADLKKQYPQLSDSIVELACNKNMDIIGLQKLIALMDAHPEFKTDIMRLSSEKMFDYDNIFKTLQDFQAHSEFRDIMFNPKKTDVNYISKEAPSPELKNKREAILKNIAKEVDGTQLKRLKSALGDKIYNIEWEKLIPPNASKSEIQKIFSDIYERTKFFARLKNLEDAHGKNGRWASEMNDISDKAAIRIKSGESFEDVISNIANDVRNDVKSHKRINESGANNANNEAGVPRNTYDVCDLEYQTPYDDYYYGEYKKYFDKIRSKKPPRQSPYPDMTVTNVIPELGLMVHPKASQSYDAGMRHINDRYKELTPFIEKVNSGQPLSKAELKQAKAKIAEIHYLLANIMPYRRGSAGIADAMTRALCKSLGIDLPPLRKGVALDLEAFHLNLDEYIDKWDSFFDY